jgi:glycosyltransferase involved in cell wall biosynthesis
LTQLLRRERVDVLHLQLIYFDGGRLPMLAGALARVPIVVTQHAAPREPVPFSKRATRSPFFVNVKRFVAVSRANQASQARYLRLPRERLTTIHNGIVVPPTCPDRAAARRRLHERLGLPEHVKLVGAVGRLTAQKGFDQLVRAAPAILQAEPNVRFAFAGDGPLRAELETHARSLGVHDSMLWLGFRSDVPELLSGFDVLAMPSVFEGLPLVLLEAFAAGCPAVANAVDGIPEIIDDGVNGFLTRPDDSTQLAERISEMLLDPERARRFSHAAHAKALKDFTVERMTRDTAALYDSVAVPEHG